MDLNWPASETKIMRRSNVMVRQVRVYWHSENKVVAPRLSKDVEHAEVATIVKER
jgi:hypothetical protein